MIVITANLTGDAADALAVIRSALDGEAASALNAVAGRAAMNYGQQYHRSFNQAGGWNSPGLRTWGPGRESTHFGDKVTEGWYFDSSDGTGATIANAAPNLSPKVYGGDIKPKRARKLTLPMVPEAHGRRVADYVIKFGRKLFPIHGKNALFESTGDGGIRAVYALSDGVTHKPWPGALPPDEELETAFSAAWREELADMIEHA